MFEKIARGAKNCFEIINRNFDAVFNRFSDVSAQFANMAKEKVSYTDVIGGRNYVQLGRLISHLPYNSTPAVKGNVITTVMTANQPIFTLGVEGFIPPENYYTLSGIMKYNGNPMSKESFLYLNPNPDGITNITRFDVNSSTGEFIITAKWNGGSAWIFHTSFANASQSGDVVTIENLQFELGRVPTAYSLAPEEQHRDITIGEVKQLKPIAAQRYHGFYTGILKITLPVSWNNAFISLAVRGYNYSKTGAWELKLSGYLYFEGKSWNNTSALLITNGIETLFTNVRFAYDGEFCCVLIGLPTTAWAYPHFVISDVDVGGEPWTLDMMGFTAWKMELITDETGITVSDAPKLMITDTSPADGSTEWFDLPLQNGFENYAELDKAQFSKKGRTIYLRGFVKHNTGITPTGVALGTLPEGFRVSRNHEVKTVSTAISHGGGFASLIIYGNGDIVIGSASNQLSFNDGSYIDCVIAL